MGIYIPGMEIPKDKAIAVVIHTDGTAYSAEMFAGVCTQYLKDCSAITVPPHGRLIDADALEADFFQLDWRTGEQDAVGFSEQAIDEAPTIIPADEEEQT